MAITINDLVKKAYRKLNVVAEGGSLEPEQLTDGISDINDIIEQWNTEKLIPYYIEQSTLTLTASQNEYTVGSGGDFNITRPKRILKGTITKSNRTYPMSILTYSDWMDIYNKNSESQLPRWLYYETSFSSGLGKIYLNYVPSEANTLTIANETQISSLSSGANIETALPPEFRKALVDVLAFEMLPRYPSEANGQLIKFHADESLNKIRRLNFKNVMVESQIDSRLLYPYRNRESFWAGA